MSEPVICPYCSSRARLVGGDAIYPHRPDLYAKQFYYCATDKAWVGCHPGTVKPLGRLADADLRTAKMAAHAAFDPIWKARYDQKHAADPKYSKSMARGGRYKKLAELMGIPKLDCHIGEFSLEQCN